MDTPPVDLIVNVFERSYREVLRKGWFDEIVKQNDREFARRVVLLNNIDDMGSAIGLAQDLVDAGEVTEYVVVEERLASALDTAGLRPRHLEPLPHFTDCALVAIDLEGSDWVLYWDVDVRLEQHIDWVTPSIKLMEAVPRVVVANPSWHDAEAKAESCHEFSDEFVLGQGFSDWAYLFRRSDFRHKSYRRMVPASWRYPLAHVVPVFEQRVDSWMRRERLLRATYLPAASFHLGPLGTAYPDARGWHRVRRRVQMRAGAWLARVRSGDPRLNPYGPDDTPLT